MNFKNLIAASGAPIYYLEMPHVKSVAMGILVKTGTRDEIWPREAGIAHAVEHMVFRGTEEFSDSKNLAAYIEDVGGTLNAWTDNEATFFYNIMPADKIKRGIHSLSQLLRKTLINEKDIKIEMQNIAQEIRRANDDPQSYLRIKADEIIYNSHFLGRCELGTEESISSFKQRDFKNFMKKFYHPANYAFIAVGNFQIKQIQDKHTKCRRRRSIQAGNKLPEQVQPKCS